MRIDRHNNECFFLTFVKKNSLPVDNQMISPERNDFFDIREKAGIGSFSAGNDHRKS
jgi:hypothetical protein